MLYFIIALIVCLSVISSAFSHDAAHTHTHSTRTFVPNVKHIQDVKAFLAHEHTHKVHSHEVSLKSGEKKTVTRCANRDLTVDEIHRAFAKAQVSLDAKGLRKIDGVLQSTDLQDMGMNEVVKGRDTPFIVHKGKRGFEVPVRYIVLKQDDGSMPGTYTTADGVQHNDYESLVTAENLESQTQELNNFFGKYGWHFKTQAIVEYKNSATYSNWEPENSWAYFYTQEQLGGLDPNEAACTAFDEDFNLIPGSTLNACTVKSATREGGMDVLNVWIDAITAKSGLLGYASFPFFSAGDNDGVVIDVGSLPRGEWPYDLGGTLVHEAGHWLGLLHTFQGGCDKQSPSLSKAARKGALQSFGPGGDFVSDTPAESEAFTGGCPAGTPESSYPDSCSGSMRGFEGRDPVHNVMDYGYDECLTQVTDGQFTNAHMMWRAFRERRDGICYSAPDIMIPDCKCHSSCATCGYSEWPIKTNNCLTCAQGNDVDSTGHCPKML